MAEQMSDSVCEMGWGHTGRLRCAGGHGANQYPCGQTLLTASAERPRTAAWHRNEPTLGTSNGVSPGTNKTFSAGGTVQRSHLFLHPGKRCHLAAPVFGGISCAPQGFTQVSRRKPAQGNASAGCCGDQHGF